MAREKNMYFRSVTTYCLFGLLQSAICLLDAHAAGPQAEWTSTHVPQAATIMTPEGKEIFQIEFSCVDIQPSALGPFMGGIVSWLRPENSLNRFTLHFGSAARFWRQRQISREFLLYPC